ncbi:MAG TPA: acyl-CoA dehydrogenase family protein [Burkholderiaceae bacterium]|nr:acyl-CoA dehydrogenase family protein [Burkholderiaceae bacterium]
MNPAIAFCLAADIATPSMETVDAWRSRWIASVAGTASPFEGAVKGGFDADRVGWAFASGYQAALRALVPDLPAAAVPCICVTEASGNRPRDIATTISPVAADGTVMLSGSKRWVTLGPASEVLLVVGSLQATQTDRAQLKVARVPTRTPGVTLQPMPPTRFVPEVPHAQMQLQDVQVPAAALLPGDGFDDYVKPFRTIEDVHVTAAVLAYLLREGRARGWPAGLLERIVAALVVLASVAASDPKAPATHIALSGALQWAQGLYAEASKQWERRGEEPAAQRWQRDLPLFEVASAARGQRAQRAWERVGAV